MYIYSDQTYKVMHLFPAEGSEIILPFSSLFSKKVFQHVKTLVLGSLLTVGRHSVCAALRFMGLSQQQCFHKYHRVLSLVKWSTLKASNILLFGLIDCFCTGNEPLVFGIDETIERRRGEHIKAKGIYRDGVRSSHAHFVKCSGLRWISMMLLTTIPWAERVWALPFLTVLAPSERYCQQSGRRHKKITDWARQMIFQLKRWLPKRPLVVVADSSYAVIELLGALQGHVSFISRLRLDAALYDPAPCRAPGKRGPHRLKGKRQPTLKQRVEDTATQWQALVVEQWYNEKDKEVLVATHTAIWYHSGMTPVVIRWVLVKDPKSKKEPVALLCSNTALSAEQILSYFIRRWRVEVSFEEVRAHLGVETQRQWNDQAIARTTPCLLGLFSLVTLWADRLQQRNSLELQSSAWYKKQRPTFSDALAAVRSSIWQSRNYCMSASDNDMIEIPKALLSELTNLLARAA
ncbi:MAG TPA: transposase [Nitrososphaera sp.]|jgi:hypothetical protein|nr:transposase [Nitrososphaera sp.]